MLYNQLADLLEYWPVNFHNYESANVNINLINFFKWLAYGGNRIRIMNRLM